MDALEIRKVVYPGRSLGYLDGKTCFTDEGLPGETVDVERLKDKPDLIEARTVGIRVRSARRVEPRCDHYSACSPYQIADYPLQLDLKAGQLKELLAGLETDGKKDIGIEPSPLVWEYRNKARFRILWTAAGPVPAYNRPGRRDSFVPALGCRLLLPAVRETVARAVAAARPLRSCLEDVEVKASSTTGEILVVLHGRSAPKPKEVDPLLSAVLENPRIVGIVSLTTRGGNLEERVLWGRRFLDDAFGGAPVRIGPLSFFQVNASIQPAVLAEMRGVLKGRKARTLADLYCGVGAFGLALLPEVETVYAVESEPEAVSFLKINAARTGSPRFTICDGTAEEWLDWILDRKVDAVIVDPPRKGLDETVLNGLIARPVPALIYLSCNPSTLARDLRRLLPAYRVVSLRGYDFFPQTPHIETLAVLEGVRS
ncbi:MAG: 23S rRNA (uracil(1939)-C(5))-methyltransferase RlmD [Candidatus Aminicenantes bacterium]|nr:23S rRNA (uracil(1939)-C(5))-methyltransferase RlmD [Candidatus Aminicenantes bacterium]